MYKHVILSIIFTLMFASHAAASSEVIPPSTTDTHYTKVGFFDIHVCNWPGRNLFFLSLFSTYEFNKLKSIIVYTPDNIKLGEIQTAKYRFIKKKGKPEKRVFITQFDIPATAKDGWYKLLITMKDGRQYEARDYVIMAPMGQATGMIPGADVVLTTIPEKLTWKAVPGAKYYQVFIKDAWEKRVIYSSELLNKTELILPKNLLQKEGYYSWRIHARDVHENILLGDFNHGSLNLPIEFSID